MGGLVVADLSSRGRLAIGGPDAFKFLQNQLTCDVREVTPARASLGALCTNKGRVAATFTLLLRDGRYVMSLPPGVALPTLEFLRRMVFRAKVAVDDVSAECAALGLAGEEAPARIVSALGPAPAAPWDVATHGAVTVVRAAGNVPRFELFGDAAALESVRGVAPFDGNAWTRLEIEAAMPWIEAATAEAFLPQFLDMDRRGGLSFTKGCFPGQEIVARTQHLGEVKRRLALWTTALADLPAAGTPLRAIHDDGERDGGTVVRSARADGGRVLVLAVVPVAECEAGHPVRLGSGQGPLLEPVPIPG